MKKNKYPQGWDEDQIQKVLAHYETQTPPEAVEEDEAAFRHKGRTMMEIPKELVPLVRDLIGRFNH